MKVLTTVLVGACFCLLSTSAMSVITGGNVVIQTLNNGSFSCDSMICPEEATKCHVSKQNDPDDLNIIIRHRRCLNANGDVVLEEKINEKNKFPSVVNLNIVSGRGNITKLTPEEQKKLEEDLKKTSELIQKQVNETLKEVSSSLGSWWKKMGDWFL